jgi:hypothetical protein
MDENERRTLLSTAFEPCDGGYLYYRNRWAGGVRVSTEEMEAFISSDAAKAFQLGRNFSKRPLVAPPRHPSPWLVADAIPYSFAAGLTTAALAATAEARRVNPPLPPTLLWVMAVFMAGFALTLAEGVSFETDDARARSDLPNVMAASHPFRP